MRSALCLIASAAEARALAPTLRALSGSGTALTVCALADAVATLEAAGLAVDAQLPGPAAVAALVGGRPARTVIVAARSELAPLAQRAATRSGAPVLPIATEPPGEPGGGLALEDFVSAARRHIEEIQPEEALRILERRGSPSWYFVDVREPDEFAAGHIPGARSSPRGFLEVRADLVHYKRDPWFEDRDRPMILYCGGGHRSALATLTLCRMGFTRVRSLAEGWTGWTEREYPVVSASSDQTLRSPER